MSKIELLGKAHNPNIDNMSPSQMRVVLEHLLYTMEIRQRKNLMNSFPGLYKMIYPNFVIREVE